MRIYIPRQSFIDNLKYAAKAEKRSSSSIRPLNFYFDRVASLAGFQSWARLHNKLQTASSVEFDNIHHAVGRSIGRALPNAAKKYVERDVIAIFKSEFEMCEDFSNPNAASDNGYSHPSVPIEEEVRNRFSDVYDEALLVHAIARLKEFGPWCEDDSEIIFEYEF
ncbi:hypothetical protein [Marinobacter nauticus]|uniref:hypothetical protein n=1 Tax=Marinobacter nauticus TaxID=2743 RepID=UPI001C980857|nr:hypothetical protein [Marinobacter nauticus]MBY6220019.1 hypothetical protein [Marinobacter nauticus]